MCNHKWRKVVVEEMFGILRLAGWECVECKRYVIQDKLTPVGLGGAVIEKCIRLRGPGKCKDGSIYQDQIQDGDNLIIIRQDGTHEVQPLV